MAAKRDVKLLDDINWDRCIICQQVTADTLVTPTECGYNSLAQNLNDYAEFNSLPTHLRLENLLHTLTTHAARYHRFCRTRFNNQKIQRLSQRKKPRLDIEDSSSNLIVLSPESSTKECTTRSSTSKVEIKSTCIFCEKGEDTGKLVCASTLGIGPNIHEKALLLNDEKLIRKLGSTDLVALEAKYHKYCYVTFLTKVRDLNRSQNLST